MVKIRMQRMGAKKNPQYVIVATNESAARDGKFFEKLGFYFPKSKKKEDKLKVDLEKINAWKAKGAQCSLTVEQLLSSIK